MNKNNDVSEQRLHPRMNVGVGFDIRLSGEAASRCRGVIADLSRGGMTFQSDAELEKGMMLYLKLPSKIEIRGEVRHVGELVSGRRRYGVIFHKIGYVPTN